MQISPLFRAVILSRRSRRVEVVTAVTTHEERRRRAAMGLDVQPVHGRHCICERCERQASSGS